MTINEIIEAGVILQCVGRVTHETEPTEGQPYGGEQVLFDGVTSATGGLRTLDLYSTIGHDWADREIRYIYPLPTIGGEGGRFPYPILAIEVE